ncbi:hypothetical protein BGX28_001847 [Mortierella sp. GBA30]|nr:hypothetical protein BGX28_001847 [Mortierella sp. GBA30]
MPSGPSLGARLAGYIKKKPPTVDQADIVLDTELTVTSWKQQEQTGLIKVPGVMLWGSNKNGLIDPSGKSAGVIQIPQRLAAFQGKVLRDLKLGDDIAAAVDNEGNVYQWGTGFNSTSHQPEVTLRNRDIAQVTLCDTKLYGLSNDGTRVFVLPKVRSTSGPTKAAVEYERPRGSIWHYVGLGGKVDDNHDPMTQLPVKDLLQKDEKIVSMASGKSHVVLVTSLGRVLGSEDGLSVSLIGDSLFRASRVLEVACGEVHSLARDDQGRCWAWGINGFGQLAQGTYSHANLKLAQPTLISDIPGTAAGVECVKIAAGGQSSYFVLKEKDRFKVKSAGMGQWGQLGDGTYTHIQGSLVTIGPLSNLAEYKEAENKMVPIGVHELSIGYTHGFAVLDNAIIQDASSTEVTITHGRDVLSWGQNTYYQLLTGKRTNKTEPVHALPLDSDILVPADKAVAAIAQGRQGKPTAAILDPTNRLQLMPAQPRFDKQDPKKNSRKKSGRDTEDMQMMEPRIVAGNGVSDENTGILLQTPHKDATVASVPQDVLSPLQERGLLGELIPISDPGKPPKDTTETKTSPPPLSPPLIPQPVGQPSTPVTAPQPSQPKPPSPNLPNILSPVLIPGDGSNGSGTANGDDHNGDVTTTTGTTSSTTSGGGPKRIPATQGGVQGTSSGTSGQSSSSSDTATKQEGTSTPRTLNDNPNGHTSSSSGGGGLSGGLIAMIIIVILAIMAAVIFSCYKIRQSRNFRRRRETWDEDILRNHIGDYATSHPSAAASVVGVPITSSGIGGVGPGSVAGYGMYMNDGYPRRGSLGGGSVAGGSMRRGSGGGAGSVVSGCGGGVREMTEHPYGAYRGMPALSQGSGPGSVHGGEQWRQNMDTYHRE